MTYNYNVISSLVLYFPVGVCGETTFTAASGTVMSPNHPDSYPNNQDCVYTIMLPDVASVVRVEFNEFELEEG